MHSRVRIKNRAQPELGNPSGVKRYEPRKRFSTAFLKSCITVTSLRHTTYRLWYLKPLCQRGLLANTGLQLPTLMSDF